MHVINELPFKAILAMSPYDPDMVKSVVWTELPPRLLNFRNLYLTVDTVQIQDLFTRDVRIWRAERLPHVVRYKGGLYLYEGHARIIRFALAGMPSTYVRIWSLDATGSQ